jgi:hypothetical protein
MPNQELLENQFIYPNPKGSKLIFFAPYGVGVNEEPKRSGAGRSQNQLALIPDSR